MKRLLKYLENNREVRKIANTSFMIMVIVMFGIVLYLVSGMSVKLDSINESLSQALTISH